MRIPPAILLAPLLPLAFVGCDPADPGPPEKPRSAFYECKGEPGYAGNWEDMLRGMRDAGFLDGQDRMPCSHTPADTSSIGLGRSFPDRAGTSAEPESLRVRTLVLDARCRPLSEFSDTLPLPSGSDSPSAVLRWDGRLSDGSRVPTGEYFLNSEWVRSDGRKDTTWAKIGLIRTSCPD